MAYYNSLSPDLQILSCISVSEEFEPNERMDWAVWVVRAQTWQRFWV